VQGFEIGQTLDAGRMTRKKARLRGEDSLLTVTNAIPFPGGANRKLSKLAGRKIS